MADLHLDILDKAHIAEPCPMRWEVMTARSTDGDFRRLCEHCGFDVHRAEAMSRQEAVMLLQSRRPVCMQITRRADGRVVTRDIEPMSVASRFRLAAMRVAAVLGLLVPGGLAAPGCVQRMGGKVCVPEDDHARDDNRDRVVGVMLMGVIEEPRSEAECAEQRVKQ